MDTRWSTEWKLAMSTSVATVRWMLTFIAGSCLVVCCGVVRCT
jgi:hypothetical protein